MVISTKQRSGTITHLLNGTLLSLKTAVPMRFEVMKPQLIEKNFRLTFGVFIGITGDIKGKLVLSSSTELFSSIGELMFGMPLEGEMLNSFSGELGNMIAGGLSTNIAEKDININITAPTIMTGDTTLSGYRKGVEVTTIFEADKEMKLFLLMD